MTDEDRAAITAAIKAVLAPGTLLTAEVITAAIVAALTAYDAARGEPDRREWLRQYGADVPDRA